MRNIKISTHLFIGFGLLLLAMLSAGISLWQLSAAHARESEVRLYTQATVLANALARQIETGAHQALAYVMIKDPVVRDFYKAGLAESTRKNAEIRQRLEPLLYLKEGWVLYRDVLQAHEAYVSGRDVAFSALEARKIEIAHEFSRERMPDLIGVYIARANELAQYYGRLTHQMSAQTDQMNVLVRMSMVVATLLALMTGFWFTWRGTRLITPPIREDANAVSRNVDGARQPDSFDGAQRREFFRMEVPSKNRATFTVLDPPMNGSGSIFPVCDISAGGLRLIDTDGLLREATDKVVAGRLDMPGVQSIEVHLRIVRIDELAPELGKSMQTVAAAYLDLVANKQVAIQQYIDLLERAMMARLQIFK